jgi:hypothetical protein
MKSSYARPGAGVKASFRGDSLPVALRRARWIENPSNFSMTGAGPRFKPDEPELSPLRRELFGGQPDATPELVGDVVEAVQQGLADAEVAALAVSGDGAPQRRLVVEPAM